VGHLAAVKLKLKILLTSEITPIFEMSHTGEPAEPTIEAEGPSIFLSVRLMNDIFIFDSQL
jgi:hypothetical protein